MPPAAKQLYYEFTTTNKVTAMIEDRRHISLNEKVHVTTTQDYVEARLSRDDASFPSKITGQLTRAESEGIIDVNLFLQHFTFCIHP